jgi:hypothetical protein
VNETRRKPRWWLRILIVVAVLGVLALGAEFALRAIIPNVIAGAVRENLGLRQDHPVAVELDGSSLLPALTGRVGHVEVTVPDVEVFDGIEATLFAQADSMPFDPTKGEIVGGSASATVPSQSMNAVVALATSGLVDTGEVGDGEIRVGKTMQIFGFDVLLSTTLAVSVAHGDLLIQPTAVSAAGFDLSTDELRSMVDEPVASMLDVHTVCVRDQLPTGITLTGLELSSTALGGSATVTADLAPDLLSNPAQQQPGSCAG